MQPITRPIVFQPFETFTVTALVTPTQISTAFTKVDLIATFYVSVDAGAANNVFVGGPGVTITNGLEIVAGAGPAKFEIRNERQLYELQEPLLDQVERMVCSPQTGKAIPYVIWDLSQLYLVAAANTVVRIAPIRSVYI